jgi:pimeloyl-ACP methyl ester carboxylesterase
VGVNEEMKSLATQPYKTGLVTSKDGTKISYRQMGTGPALVLVPGGMQAAQNFMKLGTALSPSFTVTILNRRGRSLSGPYRENHSIQREVEDLDAVLQETGAEDVFGLSAGALITLTAASTLPILRRIALYEPPLVLADDPRPMVWVPRYENELAEGNLAGGMVTGMKGIADSGNWFTALPRFVLASLMRLAIQADRRNVKADDASLESLIRSLHFDLKNVTEMIGSLDRFHAVSAEVLLIGGDRSQAFFAPILSALSGVLPRSRRVTLPSVGHVAADDVGKPEQVAVELQSFFTIQRFY